MSLWLFKPGFQWSPGFFVAGEREREREKKISFRDVKEVCDRAVITACQIAPAQEMIWIFLPPPLLFLQSSSKQKPPPPHPLSNFPWRGPAGCGVRMDREGFARGLGWEGARCVIVNVSIFVLEVCTSAWDDCGAGGWGGGSGVACNFFFQNAAIVSKIEQRRAVLLTFHSINYVLCT